MTRQRPAAAPRSPTSVASGLRPPSRSPTSVASGLRPPSRSPTSVASGLRPPSRPTPPPAARLPGPPTHTAVCRPPTNTGAEGGRGGGQGGRVQEARRRGGSPPHRACGIPAAARSILAARAGARDQYVAASLRDGGSGHPCPRKGRPPASCRDSRPPAGDASLRRRDQRRPPCRQHYHPDWFSHHRHGFTPSGGLLPQDTSASCRRPDPAPRPARRRPAVRQPLTPQPAAPQPTTTQTPTHPLPPLHAPHPRPRPSGPPKPSIAPSPRISASSRISQTPLTHCCQSPSNPPQRTPIAPTPRPQPHPTQRNPHSPHRNARARTAEFPTRKAESRSTPKPKAWPHLLPSTQTETWNPRP